MPIILPVSEVRNRLSTLLDEVVSGNEPIFITRHGHAQAVLLSASRYEELIKRQSDTTETDWHILSQASLARIWDDPDEDVYTWEDGEPV